MRAGILLLVLGIVSIATICPVDVRAHAALTSGAPNRAAAIIDNDDRMNVNNLDMVVTNHGSLAYDLLTGNAGLIFPRGTTKTAVFAVGPWIGAQVNGAIRVAMGEYSQEYVPGPMRNGTFVPDQIAFHNFAFDRAHPLSVSDLADYVAQGGPRDATGAPVLFGDATIWSVFNDANPALHTNEGGMTAPLGVEVQQTVFAYNRTGPLGNAIYVNWKLINKGGNRLDSAYVSAWSDPDLGGATDDLVGCDTTLSLGFCYNATNSDPVYGSTPPAVGFVLLRGAVVPRSPGVYDTLGMTSFVRYVNGTDPASQFESYRYMSGLTKDGSPMHVLDNPSYPATRFAVSGFNPASSNTSTNWLDTNPGDRRMMLSTGPFTMAPGQSQEILFALVIGQGSSRLASLNDLKYRVVTVRAAAPPPAPPVLSLDVTLDPATINLASRAPWVTGYVEPDGFDPAAIDLGSVRLAGVPAEPKFAVIADHDADGLPDLMLKFSRSALDPALAPGVVALELTGSLVTGERFAGTASVRVIDPPNGALAASLAPNPLNPSAILRFTTARSGAARVRLFDARGRWVRTLLDERDLPAGPHEVRIDGRGDRGEALGSGVYWFRIDGADGAATGRFALLK